MNYVLKNKSDKTTKWSWRLGALLLVSFVGLYVFCTQGLVANAVKNQRLLANIEKITLEIGELETEYVNLQNELTLEKAYELGFSDANSEFIANQAFGKNVSIRNEIQ